MVEINNITSAKVDEELIRKAIEKVLLGEKKEGIVSVAIVGPKTIKKINRNFRGKNKVTDVLSFSDLEAKDWPKELEVKEKGIGQIIVCLKEVKKTARREKIKFEDAFKSVVVHGTLHLLGYNHSNKKEAGLMEKKTKIYLN